MTITISDFWCGVIVTISIEILAFFFTALYYSAKGRRKTRRNAPESSRREDNE